MSRAIWILAVLLSHWRRHPMQLATLLIGLISATALWSGVQALNQQARLSYDRAAATFGGARTAMLVARNGATFPQQLFVDLRRAGWPVSPVLEGRIQIGGRSFRLLGIEPVTLPAEVGNAPAIGTSRLAIVPDAAGRNTGGARNARRSRSAGGRDAFGERRVAAAAARAAATGARRAGGRYRHRAAAPENAGSDIPALDRQEQSQARAARTGCRRQTSSGRAGRGERSRTPHRQFSSEPDGLRPAVVCRRPLHRQFGDRAGLRAAPADAADAARLRRVRAPAEHGAADRTGIAGAARGLGRPGLRLSDRGGAVARCRRELARTLWRADSRAIDAAAANGGSPASPSACSARWRRRPRA